MDVLSSIDPTSSGGSQADPYRPSFFELIAQEQLSSLLKPAVRYVLTVLAQRNPRYLLRIVNRFDEIYALLMLAIDRHYLRTWSTSHCSHRRKLYRELLWPQAPPPPGGVHQARRGRRVAPGVTSVAASAPPRGQPVASGFGRAAVPRDQAHAVLGAPRRRCRHRRPARRRARPSHIPRHGHGHESASPLGGRVPQRIPLRTGCVPALDAGLQHRLPLQPHAVLAAVVPLDACRHPAYARRRAAACRGKRPPPAPPDQVPDAL